MKPLLLGLTLLASTAHAVDVRLTSGWPLVLDLRGVRTVETDDARVVLASRVDAEQVLLVGGLCGVAHVVVELEQEGQLRRVDYAVRVVRGGTFTGLSQHVTTDVDAEQLLHVAGLRRVVSGDSSVCEASLTAQDTLRLVSRRPGMAVLILWVGGTSAAHRRALVVTATAGGLQRTADDVDASITEPLDGRLALIRGEHARVPVPGTRRFQAKDPDVAAARLDTSGELLVEARGVGATWVQTWDEAGTRRRLWVVVNQRSEWDPHSIDWLLRLEAERRAAQEEEEQDAPAEPAPPLVDQSRAQ